MAIIFISCLVALVFALYVCAASASTAGESSRDDDYKGMNVLCVACSSGIGRSAAEILLRGGAKVVVSSRTQSKCDDVVKPFDNAFAIAADAGKPEELAILVEESRKAFGGSKITHLVWAPTGLAFTSWASDAEDIVQTMENQMDINLYGLIRTFKLIEDDLGASKGAVVTVSSVVGSAVMQGAIAYGVAKHAQERLVKDMAVWGSTKGVRVNAVAPACILTPIWDPLGDEKETILEDFTWRHALNRCGDADEVGHTMAFLLSNKRSGFTTGQTITIDGGMQLLNSFVDTYTKYLLPPKLHDEKSVFSKYEPPNTPPTSPPTADDENKVADEEEL